MNKSVRNSKEFLEFYNFKAKPILASIIAIENLMQVIRENINLKTVNRRVFNKLKPGFYAEFLKDQNKIRIEGFTTGDGFIGLSEFNTCVYINNGLSPECVIKDCLESINALNGYIEYIENIY